MLEGLCCFALMLVEWVPSELEVEGLNVNHLVESCVLVLCNVMGIKG